MEGAAPVGQMTMASQRHQLLGSALCPDTMQLYEKVPTVKGVLTTLELIR